MRTEISWISSRILGEAPCTLLGSTKEDYADIVRWMSYANSEVFPAIFDQFGPITGKVPYNKKQVDTGFSNLEKALAPVEDLLLKKPYLVGQRVTLADLYFVSLLYRGFTLLFGSNWRMAHPNIVRWWSTITQQEILKEKLGAIEFIDEPVKYVPPKKEDKKKEEKKEEKKKEEKPAAPPAPPAEKKPAPHPLAALGPAKMPIDQWKRTYSNEETRETALPWFWENYDPEEWSLWKVAYKYNDELTLTFMSNNLIGGFFARLSASTKYLFGACVVYGENNNNGIIGAFLVRGKDSVPAFEVAPDVDSFDITPLDPSKPEDKAFVEDMWAWDKPVVINGEERPIADGKVFK
ncbi:hypothetical protein TRICI_004905 [Trichomonascus ciferrii]|uniref:Uncharacterized protein n=1 Tax=Trichomonascus ciferrii TaxID=44093 RepID=A0A642UY44_9ASCO|nr:hypothetical protein TRICI_004905 [Trichomonascus ciferrii]